MSDPEQHAVLFAFYEDYQNALEQATKTQVCRATL